MSSQNLPCSWSISDNNYSPESEKLKETLYSVANGFLGIRGHLDELVGGSHQSVRGTYINGYYESRPIHYEDGGYGYAMKTQTMLNIPDATALKILIDGQEESPVIFKNDRTLDFKTGQSGRKTTYKYSGGQELVVSCQRFASFTRENIIAEKFTITPKNFSGVIDLQAILNGKVTNIVSVNDPRVGSALTGCVYSLLNAEASDGRMSLLVQTSSTALPLACSVYLNLPTSITSTCTQHVDHEGMNCVTDINFNIAAGQEYTFERFITYVAPPSYLDSADKLYQMSKAIGSEAKNIGFDSLAKEQEAYLVNFWETVDINIEGDDLVQEGIRFNMFHLLQHVGKNGRTNVGPKGLSGEGYEGHYFWDTEAYISPFFMYTMPEISKALLEQRYSQLPVAKARAKEMHHKGALYPWRTINGEEASAFFPAGTAQFHINGDIIFCLQRYFEATADYGFLAKAGLEMTIEVARFWLSLGHFSKERGFCIHMVTGPDEYTACVDNNTYTNLLAKKNLEFAIEAIGLLEKTNPKAWQELAKKLSFDQSEIELWQKAASEMYVHYDRAKGLIGQDDGFLDRPVWDFDGTPDDKHPLLLHYHYLNIYRHQVLKQADLVLAFYLLGDQFTPAEKLRNYHYYEPLTTHDSSLSFSIYGIVASELGLNAEAYEFFQQNVRLDLDNIHGNTKDGLHMAALAGTWHGIIAGFGGMRVYQGKLHFAPRCPEAWKSFTFSLKFSNNPLKVKVDANQVSYTNAGETALKLKHFYQDLIVKPGETVTVSVKSELKAVIFDLDGVLTDTAEYHFLGWKKLADQLEIHFDREFNEELKGVGRMESLDLILQRGGKSLPLAEKEALAKSKNDYYLELIKEISPKDLFPGVEKLLTSLKEAGIKVGVASASKNATTVINGLQVSHLIDHIVDASKVEVSKPDPEVFLMAAEALQVPLNCCVGVEDAMAGVEAILKAGMPAVGISKDGSLKKAKIQVLETKDLDIKTLQSIFAN